MYSENSFLRRFVRYGKRGYSDQHPTSTIHGEQAVRLNPEKGYCTRDILAHKSVRRIWNTFNRDEDEDMRVPLGTSEVLDLVIELILNLY